MPATSDLSATSSPVLYASESGTSTISRQKALFQLVSAVTASLTAASGPEMDKTIKDALAGVGYFFSADRSYLFLFNEGHNLARNTHEWCADGVSPQIEHLQALDTSVLPGFMESLKRGETEIVNDIRTMQRDRGERHLLESQPIQSLIMVPVMAGSVLLGMFGLDIVRSAHRWRGNTIAAMELLAVNLASGLMRKNAEYQVEQLAFYDPLTSLPNRRLLGERLEQEFRHGERTNKVGALMLIDLDHFKDLNDSFGHQTGDRYLQLIANRLLKN